MLRKRKQIISHKRPYGTYIGLSICKSVRFASCTSADSFGQAVSTRVSFSSSGGYHESSQEYQACVAPNEPGGISKLVS